jgi:16S rRNA (uracil1498-N3)-methyltransferase
MRSFFVEPGEIRKPVATIGGTDARHIRKVLRLQPGARVRLTDGRGQLADARIKAVERDRVRVEILTPLTSRSSGDQEMAVGQAMLKDRKMDGVIRALTELGMTTWMPFVSTRSVAQPNPQRLLARRERWSRIAREAVKQCGRRRQPQIRIVAGLADIVQAAAGFDHKIMFWEQAGVRPLSPQGAKSPAGHGNIILVIGPEGGFTVEEAETARRAGFRLCSLGPRILRAETAAVAAVTLAQYLFGDWQRSSPP